LAMLIRGLVEFGYQGDFSFEVFNDDYAQMPLEYVTQRAMQSVHWSLDRVPRKDLLVRRAVRRSQPDLIALHT
jgi:2-keto-myo-inositol isomerase